MEQIQVTPQYVKNFSCIADHCEDHCCHGWSIFIDKSTYRFMTQKSAFKEKAQKVIVKTPKLSGFARIDLDERGVCPFRDSHGLCDVHKAHGHQRLSKTCQTYPRLDVKRGKRLERNLTLSCPEAARQILLNPQAMMFDERSVFVSGSKAEKYPYPHYYAAVRQLFVDVLMLDDLSLEARLYVLGISLKLLDGKKDDLAAFEQTFNYCIDAISNGYFLSLFDDSKSMLDMHATFLSHLYNAQLALGVSSGYEGVFARIKSVHDDMVAAMSEAGDDIALQQAILLKGFNGHYQTYFTKNSHIWVNYFLHGMYSEDFPTKGLYETYTDLVINYFMLRGALLTFASNRELQSDDIIRVIQSYHRSRSHGGKINQAIDAIINKYLQIDPKMLPLLLLKIA